jgi:FtsH-binding integral membrane protein
MRDIATKAHEVANKVYNLAVLGLFVAMVAAVVISFFVGDGFGRDLFQYVLRPLGLFVILRWVGRWAWRRYKALPGLRGFVPHKTPWAP